MQYMRRAFSPRGHSANMALYGCVYNFYDAFAPPGKGYYPLTRLLPRVYYTYTYILLQTSAANYVKPRGNDPRMFHYRLSLSIYPLVVLCLSARGGQASFFRWGGRPVRILRARRKPRLVESVITVYPAVFRESGHFLWMMWRAKICVSWRVCVIRE